MKNLNGCMNFFSRTSRSAVAISLVLIMLVPSQTLAQCIPNGSAMNSVVILSRTAGASGTATAAFVAGCAGAPGAGMINGVGIVGCSFMTSPPSVKISFTAPSQNAFTQSCQWTCGAQTCTVRGFDGLPVELMEFSITAND